jgi:hypothetical protein
MLAGRHAPASLTAPLLQVTLTVAVLCYVQGVVDGAAH